jgi:hypothetical protein
MWLIARYYPTSLFSLRMSAATTAAAKTLLCPTPYAIKLALIDAAIRLKGVQYAEDHFSWIKGLRIRISPPLEAVVNNCMIKIQRPPKEKEKFEQSPFQPTISYREYVYAVGELGLAFEADRLGVEQQATLSELLLHINSFGKRGSFFQLADPPVIAESICERQYTIRADEIPPVMDAHRIVQMLDDFGPSMTFEMANIFTDKNPDRKFHSTFLPYQRLRSSRGFTFYRRHG